MFCSIKSQRTWIFYYLFYLHHLQISLVSDVSPKIPHGRNERTNNSAINECGEKWGEEYEISAGWFNSSETGQIYIQTVWSHIHCLLLQKQVTHIKWMAAGFSSCYSGLLWNPAACLISDQHILIKLDSFHEAGLKQTPLCGMYWSIYCILTIKTHTHCAVILIWISSLLNSHITSIVCELY